jgi:hypothetical protein
MHHDAQDAQRQGCDHQEQKQDNHSIPRSVPMPVNTDDCLHVAGDGPRPVRHAAAWALGFWPECPRRSPGSSVTSRMSTTTALILTGWPSTAGRESPSEDEPAGRDPPRQSSGADAGPATPPPSSRLRTLVTLRYASLG